MVTRRAQFGSAFGGEFREGEFREESAALHCATLSGKVPSALVTDKALFRTTSRASGPDARADPTRERTRRASGPDARADPTRERTRRASEPDARADATGAAEGSIPVFHAPPSIGADRRLAPNRPPG